MRKNAHIKGFRQGAAPEGMIRKLYSEDIKAEQLQKLINKSIEDYQRKMKFILWEICSKFRKKK
ncbi:MAG: hypothetical protein IPM92_16800 [Saprospiraceae bacterium]|nr:hypothetical protein [Saprospiraceae bacterium]